jgi:hypothetical protein
LNAPALFAIVGLIAPLRLLALTLCRWFALGADRILSR